MRKLFLLTALAPLSLFPLGAQQRPSDAHQLTLETLFQPYSRTYNAAGMGLFQPASGSKTQIKVFDQAGDYHLAQQGESDYGFEFSTLRYDSFSDKFFMRGSFYYSLDREKNRKWSDVMDPWFSIPYTYGSSIAKDYDTHDCGLSLDLYTAPLWEKVSFGLKTNYRVADISGLRDPRPRTGFLDLQLVPSVLLTLGNHHIGLDAGYGYSKEKLSGLTTIQSYPNLYYYKMKGLDHVDGAISAYSGFKRQFVGSRLRGDLSYAYRQDALEALVSGGVEYAFLDAYGDKMQKPGSYNYREYNAQAELTFRGSSLVHNLRLEGLYKDAGGDEFLQELTSVKDPETGATTETWETLYQYTNIYMLGKVDASVAYRLFGGFTGKDYRWSAGLSVGYSGFDKEYHLPYSQFKASALRLGVEGSFRLLNAKGHKVELSAAVKGSKAADPVLTLTEENLYVEEVLRPDSAYYSKDYVTVGGGLEWQFPLSLGKAGKANGYVRAEGSYLKALPEGSLATVQLAVGLYTF